MGTKAQGGGCESFTSVGDEWRGRVAVEWRDGVLNWSRGGGEEMQRSTWVRKG